MSFQISSRFLFCMFISFLPPSQMSRVPVTDPTYEVQLTLDPSIVVAENVLTSIDMYSKHGQKFMCHIPDVRNKTQTTEVPKLNSSYVTSLLGINNRSACMLLKKDWWTYELCPYRYVLQFHQDGKNRVSEILLGSFDSESKWDDFSNATVQSPLKHKQWYNNGSVCDITYSQRKIEVRYECAALGLSGITKVEEVETCVYSMSVSVPGLCLHPLFVAQVPVTSERIVCSPATLSAPTTKDAESLSTSPSLPIKPRKSDPPNIFTLIRNRRNLTKHRIMKRLLRNFLRTFSAPLPKSASFGFHDAFPSYLKNLQSHHTCLTSFPLAVDRSELRRWIADGYVFAARLMEILNKIFAHPETMASLQPATRIVRSLGVLLMDLLYTKQRQASGLSLHSSPVHQQFVNASRLLIRFCEELSSIVVDSNLTVRLANDLQSMYSDPEFSPVSGSHPVSTTGPDGRTTVYMHLETKKRAPPCGTPIEAHHLHDLISLIGRQMISLQELHDIFPHSERLRAAESVFASTLHDLINGPQFRVVVLRSLDDGSDGSDKSGADTDSSNSPNQPFSSNILAMVKKAIQKVSPQASGNFEVYETHNAQGVSTVFIVSSEEKGKEMQRIRTLEQAYNYGAPNHSDEGDD